MKIVRGVAPDDSTDFVYKTSLAPFVGTWAWSYMLGGKDIQTHALVFIQTLSYRHS